MNGDPQTRSHATIAETFISQPPILVDFPTVQTREDESGSRMRIDHSCYIVTIGTIILQAGKST